MDIVDRILGWIVHAAIFRFLWALPPWFTVGIGVVTLVCWVGWRVSRR